MATDSYYNRFVSGEDSNEILEDAALVLDKKNLTILENRITRKAQKDEKAQGKKSVGPESAAGSSFVDVGKAKETSGKDKELAITAKELEGFWNELEKLDPATLLSDSVLEDFKYVGFDPDTVLKAILQRGKKAGKNMADIKKDLIDMVTVAIIKGSITEDNLKKTSDSGKVFYKGLQDTYQVITGGAKGKDSNHLTIARVAAAVPGIVIQTLIKKPEFAKTFIGPFGTKILPPYLRHQAAAACIPETAPEPLKEFLLGLITAYTADQTKVLSKAKKTTPEELYDTQLNYVNTTFSSKWPTEETRKRIFQSFSLSSDHEKLLLVGKNIKAVRSDFAVLTKTELDTHLSSLS